MKNLIFVLLLSVLMTGCYVRYPSVGVTPMKKDYEHVERCRHFKGPHGRLVKECRIIRYRR